MLTDLVQIRRLAREHETEDLRFRRHIHDHHIPDSALREATRRLLDEFDCRSCANCCRETRVEVSGDEIAAIAAELRMTSDDVARLYTEHDTSSGATVLRQEDGACVFLDRNLCMVYEARPQPCRQFPAISLEANLLGNRMCSVCRQAAICPVVYSALEEFKRRVGYTHH